MAHLLASQQLSFLHRVLPKGFGGRVVGRVSGQALGTLETHAVIDWRELVTATPIQTWGDMWIARTRQQLAARASGYIR